MRAVGLSLYRLRTFHDVETLIAAPQWPETRTPPRVPAACLAVFGAQNTANRVHSLSESYQGLPEDVRVYLTLLVPTFGHIWELPKIGDPNVVP